MGEAGTLSRTTSVRLQLAALFGGATFLVLSTWGIATYSTSITSHLSELSVGQQRLEHDAARRDAETAKAIAELSERFEALRQADDLHNWKVYDQQTWSSTLRLLNPSITLPEIAPR